MKPLQSFTALCDIKSVSVNRSVHSHPASEASDQLLILEAARVSQSVVVGFSSQLDAQLHRMVLQGPLGPQQGVVYLVTNLKVQEHTGMD